MAPSRSPSPFDADRDSAAAVTLPMASPVHAEPDPDASSPPPDSPPKPSRSFSRSPSSSSLSVSSSSGAATHRPRRSTELAIKPISTLPMDDSTPDPTPLLPLQNPRLKRPRSAVLTTSASPRSRPQRVWSTDDELAILRGLASYSRRHGALPASASDFSAFHASIRGSLGAKASTSQLSDKVRRLKQKYASLVTKAKKDAKPKFATEQDSSIFDLGGKVWGISGGAVGLENDGGESERDESADRFAEVEEKRNRKNRKVSLAVSNGNRGEENARDVYQYAAEENDKEAFPFLWEAVETLVKAGESAAAYTMGFNAIARPKALAMEEKLRRFHTSEVSRQLRRMDLMKETTKILLDALEQFD